MSKEPSAAFPEMKGFSRSNLMYMRAFAEAWPELETIGQQPVGQLNVQPRDNYVSQVTPIGQQAVGQLGETPLTSDVDRIYGAIVQQAVGRLPWGVWGARRRRRPEAPNAKPGHNIVLLTKLKVRETRLAYAQQALEHGWSRNALVAEYALRNMTLPMGVAEYQLVEALPKDLATSLPSVEQIERELGGLGAAMATDLGEMEGVL